MRFSGGYKCSERLAIHRPEVDEHPAGDHEEVVERNQQGHRLRHVLEGGGEEAACARPVEAR